MKEELKNKEGYSIDTIPYKSSNDIGTGALFFLIVVGSILFIFITGFFLCG